ncbi:hypothetical protein C8Q74DRAFT_744847 [Fomes fomentarius]|nr:hypothetical protein C8Q74DRAFT_744847 [Fomes fomentarius]
MTHPALIVRLVQLMVSELLHIAADPVCTHTNYDCGIDEIGNEHGLSPPAWASQVELLSTFSPSTAIKHGRNKWVHFDCGGAWRQGSKRLTVERRSELPACGSRSFP